MPLFAAMPRSSLAEYRQKRNFKRTPEPPGPDAGKRSGKGELTFVIQRHRATRLHYDFRLEWNGVLKSWAVPKGPSADPKDKRLAVRTEDHPLKYASFEGRIPEGQYGAGAVDIWDRGDWKPLGNADEDLRQGKLHFELHGKRLHGEWLLIRTRIEGNKENWLLRKIADREAVSLPAESPIPKAVECQLATLVQSPPEGEAWFHEIKFDGYRMICRIDGGHARFHSRNGNDWTERFPRLAEAAAALPLDSGVLDGEVVLFDPDGRSSFQSLQNAFRGNRADQLVYQVFDLLYIDGQDISQQALEERKSRLEKLLGQKGRRRSPKSLIRFTEHLVGNGPAVLENACRMGLEGIISKRRDRPYRPGRGDDWLKSKCLDRQEFVIVGYTDPAGSRAGFGALLLACHGDGKLIYAGRVGTGFDARTLTQLHARLRGLEAERSPISNPPGGRGTHWVRPELVAEVAFHGWTEDGLVRQGSFQGLRDDKRPEDVVRERPADRPKPAVARGRSRKSNGRTPAAAKAELTHPDKILFPEQGLTKQDLADYYRAIAPWMLPHVVDRPLTLVRCPEGIAKSCFHQKHAGAAAPAALGRVKAAEDDEEPYLYVRNEEGLVSLVQMGVLEIHVWGARRDKLDKPDRLVLDLDPDPSVAWDTVIEAAVELRVLLSELGVASFPKTTGGKGLHLVVPVQRRADWTAAKTFCRGVAQALVARRPKLYTTTLSKAARKGKILVDYLRNDRGSTAVAAYSTRARAGAPVSLPVSWREVEQGVRSDGFNVESALERLGSLRGDPWAGFNAVRQAIRLP